MSDDRGADARLAGRIRAGQAEALGELYDAHASMAVATALRVVGDRQEAEDVVHDAFIAVWRKIDRFDADRGSRSCSRGGAAVEALASMSDPGASVGSSAGAGSGSGRVLTYCTS